MKQLRLTGVMYPPPQQFDDANKRPLVHQCEEFVSAELDMLMSQLVGLPLLVEHCEAELVGTVEVARKTPTGAVEIEAVISASCERGRNAIRDILAKELVGLSLSHEYCLSAAAGSSTAEAIKLDLVDGTSWRALSTTDGHEIRKKCREVSICRHPRRPKCQISATVCASALKQSARGINAEDHGLDTKIVGVFSCSAMSSEQPSLQAPPIGETAPASTPNTPAEPAAEPASEPASEPAPEPAPEPMPTEAQVETREEIEQMQKAIRDAIAKCAEVQAHNGALEKQHGETITNMQKTLDANHKTISAFKEAQQAQEAEDRKKAAATRSELFNELQRKLNKAGFEVDNHPSGQESAVAAAAIKHLVKTSSAAIAMDTENHQLKRKQASLENFECGMVNASKPRLVGTSYQTWRLENPRALKSEVDFKYRESCREAAGTVIVNASKWSATEQVRPVPATASMYSDFPDMAKAVGMQNTGRMISSDETVQMMKTSNVPSRR